MPVGAKRLARGSTVLTHVYDGVIRVFVGNFYERQYYLEDFDDGLAQKWAAATGTWEVTGGGYRQSATTSNTNAYRAWAQGSAFNYEWKATYTSGTSAGFYLFASASTGAERGNSYRIWQDATTVKLYESASDVATQRASWAAANAAGQTHTYQVSYDPLTGSFSVKRDGATLGSWTDPTPLTSGNFVALRTDAANVLFDDIKITRESKYYYAGSQRVAVRHNNSAQVNYLLGDHLGSTALTTNQAGARLTELRYYPWGDARYNAGSQVTKYRFTGQPWDGGTGLYFYGARWYDPAVGRFLQADTIVPGAGNPQALNRYSYVLNNPLRYTDPTGHWPIPPIGPIVREMARVVSNLPWMASVTYASYREAKGDAPEALSLTLDWYHERGEAPRYFDTDSEVTQFLITSQGMQEARQKFIKEEGKDMLGLGKDAYRHEFTVGEFFGELGKAITKDNWSGSFLGSFDVEFENVQGYDGPGKLVNVRVINDTGWASATKIPILKTTKRQNVDRSEPGPGGTLWQYYRWQEVIDAE